MENKMSEKSSKISADVDEELAGIIVKTEYGISVARVSKLDGYDDLNFHIIEASSSPGRTDLGCDGFILKIINWKESNNVEFFKEYVNVLCHLRKENIPCPQPIKNKSGEYSSYWIDRQKSEDNGNDEPVRRHLILLLRYLNGQLLKYFKFDEKVGYAIGCLVSELHVKLQPFNDSEVLKRADYPWSLQLVPQIRILLNEISLDEEKRKLVLKTVKQFENEVLSKLDELEKGVIHNDINEANILVERSTEEGDLDIVGVIDFADMLHASYLFDIAITVCYLVLNNPDDCENLIKGFLLGYKRRRLTDLEYRLLKSCICARLCQSLIMGLHAHSVDPTNQYVLTTQKLGWSLLNRFSAVDNEKFVEKLRGLTSD